MLVLAMRRWAMGNAWKELRMRLHREGVVAYIMSKIEFPSSARGRI